MDKETISKYGWVTIVLIILILLLGFASPFGNFIMNSFKGAYKAMGEITYNDLGIITPLEEMPGYFTVTSDGILGIREEYSGIAEAMEVKQLAAENHVSVKEYLMGSLSGDYVPTTEEEFYSQFQVMVKADVANVFNLDESFATENKTQTEVLDAVYTVGLAQTLNEGSHATMAMIDNAAKELYLADNPDIIELNQTLVDDYDNDIEVFLTDLGIHPEDEDYEVCKKLVTLNFGLNEVFYINDVIDRSFKATDLIDVLCGNVSNEDLEVMFLGTSIDDYAKTLENKKTLPKEIGIPSEIDGTKVTSIPSHLFHEYTTHLTKIQVPGTVKNIDSYTFEDMTSLRQIILKDGVEKIGASAFMRCSSLISVQLPSSLQEINNNVFYNCTSLKNINLPNAIQTIGSGAFYNCSSLPEINIPDSVTYLGDSAFRNCSSISKMKLSNSLTSISNYTFESCTALKSITIPENVTSIGSYAFAECDSISSLVLPEKTISLGDHSFSSCDSLKSLRINGNLSPYYYIFADSPIEKIIFGNNVDNTLSTSLYTFPELKYVKLGGLTTKVSSLGGCQKLEAVIIPESVTEISPNAFYNCSSLKNIKMSNAVTKIGKEAFWGCSSLENINIPNGVTSIGDYAFCYCSALKGITIPDSVTNIDRAAFGHCSSLKKVTLSKNTESIESVFYDCTSLETVVIPYGIKDLSSAFVNCTALKNVTLSNSVTNITHAFRGCTSLESIVIPDSVTITGQTANYGDGIYSHPSPFEDCTSLKHIVVGSGIYQTDWLYANEHPVLEDITFRGLSNFDISRFSTRSQSKPISGFHLKNITFDCEINYIVLKCLAASEVLESITISDKSTNYSSKDGVLFNKDGTILYYYPSNKPGNDYIVPNGVQKIAVPGTYDGSYVKTFGNCKNLKTITIPSSVTEIMPDAFEGCSTLTTVKGSAGSYAETWASANGYNFVAI